LLEVQEITQLRKMYCSVYIVISIVISVVFI
jgi:hypothetical protein